MSQSMSTSIKEMTRTTRSAAAKLPRFAPEDREKVLFAFADGFRYGFGAEVGISTGKLHPRGPVGLDGITTYKYVLEGSGQIVGDYTGHNARKFTHKDL